MRCLAFFYGTDHDRWAPKRTTSWRCLPRGMDRPPPSGRWMTPSELAEHTFCPRAWWYARQDQDRGRSEAFEHGLQVQAELQAAHLAMPEPRRFPWGAVAALCLVLVGGFVLWTFRW